MSQLESTSESDLSDSSEAKTIKQQNNKSSPSTSKAEVRFRTRIQRFSHKWLTDPQLQGWIQVAEHDNLYAKCNACIVYLKAKYSDLVSHAQSKKHKNAIKKLKCSQKVDTMLKDKTSKNQEHVDVVCATLRTALLVSEHNLSFNVTDHITKVNKVNFKDSKTAESMQLSRTKCTMIIQNVLADVVTDQLKQQIYGKRISVLLDEATDVSNKKLLCILVKFIDGCKVKTQVLGLKEVDADHGTAKGLYTLLKESFAEFSIEEKNVVGYCSDNASVMVGSKESVKKYLLNSNPHLISNGCICHTIHLVAVSATGCLPQKLENLLQNISTYFSRSPKRQSVLETFQEYMNSQKLKILKPSATRWLALSKCIDRILEMWDVLKELFRLADFEQESDVATIIYNELCNPINKAYLSFLKFILPLFNQFNAFFQSEKLLTPIIYSECMRFLKSLGYNFLKKEYLSDEIININCMHPHTLLPINNIQIGSTALNIITSFDQVLKEQFLLKCLAFYQKAFQEAQSRFPLNDFYKNLNFMQIETVFNLNSNINIQHVAAAVSPETADSCVSEYNQLKIYFTEETKLTLPQNVIEFWKYLGGLKNFNDEFVFKNISELALTILCIPHGNADVERIFSNIADIKTKKRNRLSTVLLESVLRVKQDLRSKEQCCHEYEFTNEHFKRYNKSMYTFKN